MLMHSEARIRYNFYPIILAKYTVNVFVFEGWCNTNEYCHMYSGWITTGIKVAKRNTNNLRYANGSTLMAESKEELKNLLMRVKLESEKDDIKFNIQKTKIMHPVPSLMANISGKIGSSDRFCTFGLQNYYRLRLQPWN